jgi:type I restriction enzyme S subunit
LTHFRLDNNKLIPKYLSSFFTSINFKNQLASVMSQTTRNQVPITTQRKLNIILPPLETQKKIANILSTLDDKIELNRKMNQTLEEMAQTLFKSWFVDFDPVHALLNRGDKTIEIVADDLGISKDVLELFPSEFEESELGMIPKRWDVSTIEKEVTIYGGATPSTKESKYWDNGTNFWATPRDLSSLNSKILTNTNRKITDDGVKKISSKQLPIGTVLLSSRAPVGYIAYSTVPISINQGFIAMVCNKKLSNYFIIYWLEIAMKEIKNRAIGTTFAEISKSAFKPIKLVVPSTKILTNYNQIVSSIIMRIKNNEEEIQILQKTRDTLLPKLLSGEIEL